jgi:hypothetical protein
MADIIGELVVQITGDTKQYDKSIDKSEKKLNSFSASAKKVGATLKKFVTVPVLAAAAASLKFASDAEEANAKFNTAFRGIEDRASETAKTLSREYGLARQTSEKLLGDTGDLLKGFGATATGALDFSQKIQELSVDLSSYNNVVGGASRVSGILTKSVLGNKDGLSELGVSLLDVDIKQELVRTGQDKLTGQAGKLAKAQATFNLILQQTVDAQGDYQRTSGSAANQTKLLLERGKDLAVSFGNELLPLFTDLASKSVEALQGFADLDGGTKRLVIGIGAVTAGIAPAIKGVQSLGVAFKTLGAVGGPVALVALSITGIIAGIKLLKDLRLSALEKEFAGVSNEAGLSATAINNVANETATAILLGGEYNEVLRNNQKEYGISRQALLEAITIGGRLEGANLNRALKELDGLKRTQIEQDKKNKRLEEERVINERLALEEEARQAEIEALRVIELATLKQIRDEKEANVQAIIDSAKTESQLIDEQIEDINSLGDANNKLTSDQLEAINILNERKKEISEEEVTLREEEATKLAEIALKEFEEREKLKDEEAARDEERRLLRIERRREEAQFILDSANNISQIISNLNTKETQELNEKHNNVVKNITTESKTLIEALDKDKLGQEEYQKEVDRINQEAEDKKKASKKETALKVWEIEKQQFNIGKALALSQIAIDTAIGVAKVYGQVGIFGLAAQVPVIAAGALQAGVVLSQPEPPRPAFRRGGTADGETTATIGEEGEVLFGMGASGKPLFDEFVNRTVQGLNNSGNKGGDTFNFYGRSMLSNSEMTNFAQQFRPFQIKENQRRGATN